MKRSLLLAFAFALPLGLMSPSFAASGDGSSAGGSAGTTNETNATTPNRPKPMAHTTHKSMTHTAQKTSNPMSGGATSTTPPGTGPGARRGTTKPVRRRMPASPRRDAGIACWRLLHPSGPGRRRSERAMTAIRL
jgi:hypothetical protein